MSVWGKLFGFRGRLSRLDWWLFAVALNLAGAALSAALSAAVIPPDMPVSGELNSAHETVGIAVALILLWPTLAITVKRRHDRGVSGWLSAVVFVLLTALNCLPLLYLALSVFGFEKAGWWGAAAAFVVPAMLWLTLLILLGFLPGDRGENRYGPSPSTGPAA